MESLYTKYSPELRGLDQNGSSVCGDVAVLWIHSEIPVTECSETFDIYERKKGINNDINSFFWETGKLILPFDDMEKTGRKRLIGYCFAFCGWRQIAIAFICTWHDVIIRHPNEDAETAGFLSLEFGENIWAGDLIWDLPVSGDNKIYDTLQDHLCHEKYVQK